MDFTIVHPHWFLLGLVLAFFPRTSTACMALFGSLMLPLSIGYRVLWCLGWVLSPRLLIAILALAYFPTNPVIVVVAWCLAFSGEVAEKKTIIKVKSK